MQVLKRHDLDMINPREHMIVATNRTPLVLLSHHDKGNKTDYRVYITRAWCGRE
jgi:hypothetical protein